MRLNSANTLAPLVDILPYGVWFRTSVELNLYKSSIQVTAIWRMTWILDSRVLSGSWKNYWLSKYWTECDQNTEQVRYLNPNFRMSLKYYVCSDFVEMLFKIRVSQMYSELKGRLVILRVNSKLFEIWNIGLWHKNIKHEVFFLIRN